MSSAKPLVLVTGASGFVGSHVIVELLKAGYPVRGTARGKSIDLLRETAGAKYPNLQFVQVDDLISDDLTEALQGVGAIIHVASPLPGKESPANIINMAINGTLNTLRQAVKANISKVVITSSWAAYVDPSMEASFKGIVFSEKDWGNIDEKEVITGEKDSGYTYIASKNLAEKAAWKFALENPSLDIATITPPFIYGPFAEGFPFPSQAALGTNRYFYSLLTGPPDRALPSQVPPFTIDVRDVARAHVLALDVPPVSNPTPATLQEKRVLIYGGTYTWKDVVNHLRKVGTPEVKGRLPSQTAVDRVAPLPGVLSTFDVTRAKTLLGLDSYVPWEKTVEDTVESMLEAIKSWE